MQQFFELVGVPSRSASQADCLIVKVVSVYDKVRQRETCTMHPTIFPLPPTAPFKGVGQFEIRSTAQSACAHPWLFVILTGTLKPSTTETFEDI